MGHGTETTTTTLPWFWRTKACHRTFVDREAYTLGCHFSPEKMVRENWQLVPPLYNVWQFDSSHCQ